MSFISFNKAYYQERINYYDSKVLSYDDIIEAKQLLKILDDLVSEKYFHLYDELGKLGIGATKLRQMITEYGELPFDTVDLPEGHPAFDSTPYEVTEYISCLANQAKKSAYIADTSIINELVSFCQWIKKDDDTAYIFLLRDTFIPYLFFRAEGVKNIHPWMIGRRFTELFTGEKYFDDVLRAPIYTALENGVLDFDEFKKYCCSAMLNAIKAYPLLVTELKKLLHSVTAKKIVVVESGYCGTFPLLLCALDERVDFRMFTTAPYLKNTYKDRVYTNRYELVRDIETLYSQELLFELCDYKDGAFFVRENTDAAVRKKALAEIKKIIYASENGRSLI